jgi:hypothetical protein
MIGRHFRFPDMFGDGPHPREQIILQRRLGHIFLLSNATTTLRQERLFTLS